MSNIKVEFTSTEVKSLLVLRDQMADFAANQPSGKNNKDYFLTDREHRFVMQALSKVRDSELVDKTVFQRKSHENL
jgi:hypothetical protein